MSSSLKRHVLQVSTYQMCVLMLFNNRAEWTFEVTNVCIRCMSFCLS